MKNIKILLIAIFSIMSSNVFAANTMTVRDMLDSDPNSETVEEILARVYNNANKTECASAAFLKSLQKYSDKIEETDSEQAVKLWAHASMTSDQEILNEVLACPEVANVDQYTTIVFSPVNFTFPGGRTLTINYTTQKKVLEQKLDLAKKRDMFDEKGNPNPKLMDPADPHIYLNTEPAWYAIMVVQHDTLKDFVGPGKNNTVSMQYIEENIGNIYPRGYHCTSKSAIALNSDTINQVVHKVVNMEGEDDNDYYVAGDIDLGWIFYAEIAADILITALTWGGGQAITGSLKAWRASRTGMQLAKNMNKLKKFERVDKYLQATNQIDRINEYQRLLKEYKSASKTADIAKYESELQDAFKYINKADPSITEAMLRDPDKAADLIKGLNKTVDNITDVSKELKETEKLLKQAEKAADPDRIKEFENAYKELDQLRDAQENGTTIARIKNDAKRAEAQAKFESNQQRIKELENTIKNFENSSDMGDYVKYRKEVDNLESVEKYTKQADALNDVLKYHEVLTGYRKQTGNIITKNLKRIGASIKSYRAINKGAWTLTKAGYTARAGMSSFSSKVGNWLFDATLKHGSRYGRLKSKLGKAYGGITAAKIVLDLYDHTSTTSSEFTNGITFKPFCLLSADDIPGQDNVVNYGMWLMWEGNSTEPYDDDAAYLEAVDFATKFFYELDEFQDNQGSECNVDIYVVRPIIRLSPNDEKDSDGELLYLFMNEIPWSTAEQFHKAVPDVKAWEKEQEEKEKSDPDNKYGKNTTEENTEETPQAKPEKPMDIAPIDPRPYVAANDSIPDLRPGAARQHPGDYNYTAPEPMMINKNPEPIMINTNLE